MNRVDNFNAGPSAIPLVVLERIREELLDFRGTGMSVMELSHRSDAYETMQQEAEARLRRLMGIPDSYHVLFLQGGASLQFTMLPMNFLREAEQALYVVTGAWAEKAAEEATRFGQVLRDESAKATGYTSVPSQISHADNPSLAYVHLTTNNTIYGTQWRDIPQVASPLALDMSSDILSRPIDVTQSAMIYAGAQKNLGPSGVTVVILSESFAAKGKGQADVPTMLRYSTHSKAASLYNTPPTFAIYVMHRVLEWVEEEGGVPVMARRSREKSSMLYSVIDEFPNLFHGHADVSARSEMNVTFRLRDEALLTRFFAEAKDRKFVGIQGHRSVGGCRVSLYNAVPVESAARFAEFMRDFATRNH